MIQLLIKVGLAVLIIGGLVSMATNGFGNFESGLDSVCNKKKQVSSVSSPGFNQLDNLRPLSAASIAVLAFNGGFAYDGWNQLNFITEEIKDPMKNLPRLLLMKNNSKLNDLSGEKHFYYLFC